MDSSRSQDFGFNRFGETRNETDARHLLSIYVVFMSNPFGGCGSNLQSTVVMRLPLSPSTGGGVLALMDPKSGQVEDLRDGLGK